MVNEELYSKKFNNFLNFTKYSLKEYKNINYTIKLMIELYRNDERLSCDLNNDFYRKCISILFAYFLFTCFLFTRLSLKTSEKIKK